jgi:LmbE family N-acetylglucosaminyl deacetylase
MATIVFVHAHPDDEAGLTGGSMARAAAEGHRVVLVICTDGANGETPDDLGDGETLVDRRRAESAASAEALGIAAVHRLGYKDSGMAGWPQNGDPDAFCQADVAEAGERLATILSEEAADVVVLYDWHGNYGHPDHVQVHRVGHRAADLAATPHRFEATMNRDFMVRHRDLSPSPDAEVEFDPNGPMDDGNPLGSPEAEIGLAVDVTPFLAQKRQALAAHASQVTDIGMMLSMPPAAFDAFFGTEWYIVPGSDTPLHGGWLLDGVGAA